ncbi:MAG: molybdopterin-guanine dinucleotide biosynthesis protein B [Rickettsiales bacterium]|nr:molybdopterin-guanine dinucleotide biosynthesis protein B [Rickettsiales bacterium]RPG15776.1 MAG: molybdopterin-guanine dinucleotide biosynthesis protein B [Pelagibacteraceae bacterium TMED195]
MRNIFGIVGWSGSGKTHLICRIIKYFDKKKINVCSIKHSHHNFEIDKKGKDSYEHLKSGSNEVVIYNEYKFAMITKKKKKKITLKDIVKKFSLDTDIILIEGLKKGPNKKIEVYRDSIKKPLLCQRDKNIKALIFDKVTPKISKISLPKFHIDETKKIGSFILKEIKNEKQ